MQNGEPLSGKIILSLSQNFDSIKFVVFCFCRDIRRTAITLFSRGCFDNSRKIISTVYTYIHVGADVCARLQVLRYTKLLRK